MTQPSLRMRTISAFSWGVAGSVLKLAIQVGAQIFLARLLGPEHYGLFAIGVIIISLSNFLSDIGLAYGLIQLPVIDRTHVRFIFTWQLVLGLAVSAVVAGLAGPLAHFFNEPRAAAVIFALAPLCFLQAVTAVSLNLIKRELDFKSLQIIQTGAYVLGYLGVGIPLALAGWGVWSLVWAWTTQVAVTLVLLFGRVRHPVTPLLRHPEERSLAAFGSKVLATNLTNWLLGNVDRVLVARYFPAVLVGLYTTPYNLMYTPATTLMGVLQPVMYSACARVQGEKRRIANAYVTLTAAISLAALPVFAVIATIADTFVLALYGQAWREAASVLQPVALAMPFLLLWNATTPVLWTNGRPGLEFKMQLPMIVVWLVAIAFAAQYSIAAVAWTVAALYVGRCMVFVLAACRMLDVPLENYLRGLGGGVALSVALAVIAWFLDWSLAAQGHFDQMTRLLFIIFVSAASSLAMVRLFPRLLTPELANAIRQGAQRMPAAVGSGVIWWTGGQPGK